MFKKLLTGHLPLLLVLCCLHGCSNKFKPAEPDFSYSHLPSRLAPIPPPYISDRYLLEIDQERIELTREYLRLHHRNYYQRLPEENTLETITFEPRIVVVHYTVMTTLEEVIDYFKPNKIASARTKIAANGALNVGVQFIVDRDGAIYRFYPENVISRHTIGLNHTSIGIENVGDADLDSQYGKAPLTPEQLEANARLIHYLKERYSTIDFVIGHSEYRELEDYRHPAHNLFKEDKIGYRTEKSDPGPVFMSALRNILGQWADESDNRRQYQDPGDFE